MTISRRQFTLSSLALLAVSLRDAHSQPPQARVLIVDGVNNHDWKTATHAITEILTATELDPSWPSQIGWAQANLGRAVDASDIAAARPA